jgi:hypothetical protein
MLSANTISTWIYDPSYEILTALSTVICLYEVYNRAHLCLVANSIEGWLQNSIEKDGRAGGIENVLPGHGEPIDHSILFS